MGGGFPLDYPPRPPGGTGTTVAVDDEGVEVLPSPDRINFEGAGVNVTVNEAGVNVTIPAAPAGAAAIPVGDEGSQIVSHPATIDFVGAGVQATADGGGNVTINIPGAAPSNISASDEGTLLTGNVSEFDFIGAGVTATEVGGVVTVNIPAASAGAYSAQWASTVDRPVAKWLDDRPCIFEFFTTLEREAVLSRTPTYDLGGKIATGSSQVGEGRNILFPAGTYPSSSAVGPKVHGQQWQGEGGITGVKTLTTTWPDELGTVIQRFGTNGGPMMSVEQGGIALASVGIDGFTMDGQGYAVDGLIVSNAWWSQFKNLAVHRLVSNSNNEAAVKLTKTLGKASDNIPAGVFGSNYVFGCKFENILAQGTHRCIDIVCLTGVYGQSAAAYNSFENAHSSGRVHTRIRGGDGNRFSGMTGSASNQFNDSFIELDGEFYVCAANHFDDVGGVGWGAYQTPQGVPMRIWSHGQQARRNKITGIHGTDQESIVQVDPPSELYYEYNGGGIAYNEVDEAARYRQPTTDIVGKIAFGFKSGQNGNGGAVQTNPYVNPNGFGWLQIEVDGVLKYIKVY